MDNDKKTTEMKEQIAMHLRKKDYYEILGVSKTCTEAQIKKAYKKLALRFHPDKNAVEEAKQVFKKVSAAYVTLSNVEKRAEYDRFGPEEDRQPAFRPTNRYYRNSQDEFEQVFQAFFGGNLHRRTYTYTFNSNPQPPRRNQNQNEQQTHPTFNFFYLFLVLGILYLIPLIFREKPQFSFIQDSQYGIKSQSQIFGVTYFIRSDLSQKIATNIKYWRQLNQKVETQYLLSLYQECENAEKARKKYELQAYRYRPGGERERLLQKRNKVDLSSCRIFAQLRQSHNEYVRKLIY